MQAKYRHALPQTGRCAVPDRRRPGDDADLSRRHRAAAFRGLRAARRPRSGGRRCGAISRAYVAIARRDGRGLVLETPTWRSNPDWGAPLGYAPEALDAANAEAVAFVAAIRDAEETPASADGAERRHRAARRRLRAGEPDERRGGRGLPSRGRSRVLRGGRGRPGHGVHHDLRRGGRSASPGRRRRPGCRWWSRSRSRPTAGCARAWGSARRSRPATRRPGGYPAYYMVNCAHPTHFRDVLAGGAWLERIGGIRANASKMSHAELDEAPELDAGDPAGARGATTARCWRLLPRLRVLGGCCGTDHRHIGEISHACEPSPCGLRRGAAAGEAGGRRRPGAAGRPRERGAGAAVLGGDGGAGRGRRSRSGHGGRRGDEGAFSWRNAVDRRARRHGGGRARRLPDRRRAGAARRGCRRSSGRCRRSRTGRSARSTSTCSRPIRRSAAAASARALLAEAERQAAGARGLSLIVADRNAPARRLYEAFGFVEAARRADRQGGLETREPGLGADAPALRADGASNRRPGALHSTVAGSGLPVRGPNPSGRKHS